MNKNSFIYRFLKRVENPSNNIIFYYLNTFMCLTLSFYGKILARSLTHKNNATIILFASRSAGDTVFLSYLFKDFLKVCKINNYILVVDSGSCYKAAKSLNFENLYPVNVLKLKALLIYQRVNIFKEPNVVDCYPWCMFDLMQSSYGFKDNSNNNLNKIIGPIEENISATKDTILLCPYENSITEHGLPKLPVEFWNNLVIELKKLNYKVFTNCSGKDNEPVLQGTEKIFPDFSEIQKTLDEIGKCVMIRSGFSDFALSSKADKIVLYPNKKSVDYWSLYRTNNNANCYEIIYEEYLSDYSSLIQSICDHFEKSIR